MFRLCLRYAKDWPEAEDLLQDGFIKVFSDLPQFRFEGPLGGWVRKVILNVALQHVRRQQKLFVVEEIDRAAEMGHPDSDIISRMDAEALTRLLQQLPAGYRAVFNLYVIEEYSHQEIAEMLGIDPGTSKSQLFKAKKTLRTIIERTMITCQARG